MKTRTRRAERVGLRVRSQDSSRSRKAAWNRSRVRGPQKASCEPGFAGFAGGAAVDGVAYWSSGGSIIRSYLHAAALEGWASNAPRLVASAAAASRSRSVAEPNAAQDGQDLAASASGARHRIDLATVRRRSTASPIQGAGSHPCDHDTFDLPLLEENAPSTDGSPALNTRLPDRRRLIEDVVDTARRKAARSRASPRVSWC